MASPGTTRVTGCSTCCVADLVAPLNGSTVLAEIEARRGAGLFDRLIADDYARSGLATLTLDREMSALPEARSL